MNTGTYAVLPSPPGQGFAPQDPAQEFLSRLRLAAPGFAAAAGAQTAIVQEVVPPARHRRSSCRVVLRYRDGAEADVTFLGPAGRAAAAGRGEFDTHIERWLGTERRREGVWLVPDDEAADGVAVDVVAWLTAG